MKTKGFQGFFVTKKARKLNTTGSFCELHSQRGAEAALSEEGMAQNNKNAAYYMQNARILRESLQSAGVTCYGGYAPYVWAKCPFNMTGEKFFDFLLNRAQIAGTPGGGFGKNGEYYFRFSAFCSRENALLAAERLQHVLRRG